MKNSNRASLLSCLFLVLALGFSSEANAEEPALGSTSVTEEPAAAEPSPVPEEAVPSAVEGSGYLPDEPKPNEGYLPDETPVHDEVQSTPGEEVRSPIRGGLNLMVGFQIPTGGDLRNDLGRRDISGTLDAGIGVLVSLYDRVQIGATFRGGMGGFDSNAVVSGTEGDPSSKHFWVGSDLRINLTNRGRVRPFVSGMFGGDRLADVYSRGTGDYQCENLGNGRFNCEEETERVFSVGYWGLSTGLGAGFRLVEIAKGASLVVEMHGVRNRYGRLTSSAFDNMRLREDSRTTWQVGTLVMFQVGP